MCPLGLQRGAARTPSIIAHLTPSTLRLGKKTTLHTRAPPASALRVCRRSRARHGAPSLSTLSAAVLASTAPPATARRASCAQGSRHGVCACARGGDDAERVRREAAARREGPKGKGAPDPAALATVVVCSQSPHPFERFVGGPSHNVMREHEQSGIARTGRQVRRHGASRAGDWLRHWNIPGRDGCS